MQLFLVSLPNSLPTSIVFKFWGSCVASYTAVFSVTPPLSFVGREWGSDTKNGCMGGYTLPDNLKKPVILCACSMSRSSEQHEMQNMQKVCLFYQSKQLLFLNMADTFFEKFMRDLWAPFSWLCFLDANWLGRQTALTRYKHDIQCL